jgi:hypothetical protein
MSRIDSLRSILAHNDPYFRVRLGTFIPASPNGGGGGIFSSTIPLAIPLPVMAPASPDGILRAGGRAVAVTVVLVGAEWLEGIRDVGGYCEVEMIGTSIGDVGTAESGGADPLECRLSVEPTRFKACSDSIVCSSPACEPSSSALDKLTSPAALFLLYVSIRTLRG